jgi:hypothetical protein
MSFCSIHCGSTFLKRLNGGLRLPIDKIFMVVSDCSNHCGSKFLKSLNGGLILPIDKIFTGDELLLELLWKNVTEVPKCRLYPSH